ncbi:redox-regulated ATPase YchF [Patescibacteria group bacterium]
MNLSCGIVGLPNAGKSTLFNALIQKQQALSANYPFATIEPNVGIVPVNDPRLEILAKIVDTKNIIPSTIKFVDIAGLVKGAHEGEGLGNKFLSHIREVDLIVHVLRNFDDGDVVQTGSGNALEDFNTIKTELILADLQTLEKQSEPKGNSTPEEKHFWKVVIKAKKGLSDGSSINEMEWSEDEKELLSPLFLLSGKPTIFILNVGENQIRESKNIEKKFSKQPCISICAKIESELVEFTKKERQEYLKENGLEQTGLDRLVTTAFFRLNLISFLTAGEKEVRSWTIENNTLAPQAAGVIHSDFETNFIKAQVCSYENFTKVGGWQKAKENGLTRMEGRDYKVRSDDIIEFMIGK